MELPGPAVTLAPVLGFKPVTGNQVKEIGGAALLPAASKLAFFPLHMLTEEDNTKMVGKGAMLTATFTLAVLVHPLASVPATVYMVVTVGLADTDSALLCFPLFYIPV